MSASIKQGVIISKLHDAVVTISKFDKLEWLRKNSERVYGLPYEDALEFAYENAINIAKAAAKGTRLPKQKAAPEAKS